MTHKYSFSQKQINGIALLLLGIMMTFILFSGYSIKQSVRQEQASESIQLQFQKSSQKLSDASDYLTEEVRKFVVTGNPNYMERYWKEVNKTKSREEAISSFSASSLPVRELQLLKTAKNNSDLLISTEIRAMKLASYSHDVPKDRMEPAVKNYVLNVADQQLGKDQAGKLAANLVFGSEYESQKTIISGSIKEFQQHMDSRLKRRLYQARNRTGQAVEYQTAALSVSFFFVAAVLFIFYRFSVSPILEHTAKIRTMGDKVPPVFLSVKGSRELRVFAQKFNQMYEGLLKAGNEKSRFFSNMSHEIRTPLNSIVGYEILMRDTKLTRKQEQYLDIMREASETLLNLINQILDISKYESGKMKKEERDFPSREFFQGILDMFRYRINDNKVALNLTVKEEVPWILRTDSGKLRQILLNLLSNSMKFTEEGEIHVCVSISQSPGQELLLRVSVSDTGIGIRKEDLSRIFQAFEQSAEVSGQTGRGTGLGLTISKDMAEFLGGTLRAESKEGSGSRFILEIPVHRISMSGTECFAGRKQQERKADLSLLNGRKVLLIEDNDVNRMMAEELLKKFGLHIHTASRGRDAIRLAQEEKYDVIFMDIRMKPLDGFQTAKEILYATKNYDTSIIAMTADVESSTIQRIFREGMQGFLPKPFSMSQLQKALLDSFGILTKEQVPVLEERKTSVCLNADGRTAELGAPLYKQLVSMFITHHEKEFLILNQELPHKQLLHLLHTLKGVSGNIGAELLQEKLILLEKDLNHQNLGKEEKEQNISDIKSCYNQTKKAIIAYLDTVETKPIICPSQLFDKKKFVELMESSDLEAAEMYEKHTSLVLSLVMPLQRDTFRQAMESYDFQQALNFLSEEEEDTDV